nr:hypothetical protein OG296_43555 [Streptomyces sp. NBC_01001]
MPQADAELETRQLTTGDRIVFDRRDKTLYLLTKPTNGDTVHTREELKELTKKGSAVALSKAMLASLYEEFLHISVLLESK